MEFFIRCFFVIALIFIFIQIIKMIVATSYTPYGLTENTLPSPEEYRYVNRKKRSLRTAKRTKQKRTAPIAEKHAVNETNYSNSNYNSYQSLKNRYK